MLLAASALVPFCGAQYLLSKSTPEYLLDHDRHARRYRATAGLMSTLVVPIRPALSKEQGSPRFGSFPALIAASRPALFVFSIILPTTPADASLSSVAASISVRGFSRQKAQRHGTTPWPLPLPLHLHLFPHRHPSRTRGRPASPSPPARGWGFSRRIGAPAASPGGL